MDTSAAHRAHLVSALILALLLLTGFSAGASEHGAPPGGPADATSDALPAAWTKLGTPVGPDPRLGHAMVAAPEFGLVIMVGGLTPHGVDSDVWLIRPGDPEARWFTPALQPGPDPGPRQSHSLVWDSKRHRMILFGGYNPAFAGQPNPNGRDHGYLLPRDGYNDVWALEFDASGNATRWQQLFGTLTGAHAYGLTEPVERWNAAAIYDSKRDRLIVTGGVNRQINSVDDLPKNPCAGVCVPNTEVHAMVQPYGLPDTWSFDLAGTGGWTLLDPDGPKQTQFFAAYDAANDTMVTVRHYGLRTSFNDMPPPPTDADIRSLDLATNQWTDWPDPPQHAAPGFSGALGYLGAENMIVALGYEWDPWPTMRLAAFALHLRGPGNPQTRWERLPGTPSDRSWDGEGADPEDPIAGSTWGYDVAGTLLPGPGSPRFVAFGGSGGSTNVLYGPTELPVYDLAARSWSEIPGTPLFARYLHAAVLDPGRGHMYLLGGHVGGLRPDHPDSLWRMDVDSGAWETIEPAGDPPPGVHTDYNRTAMAVHDPAGDRILQMPTHGPVNCGGEVHALDLEELEWSRLDTEGETPMVCEANLVYDSTRHRVVLLNGFTTTNQGVQTRNRAVFALDLTESPPAWSQVGVTGAETGVLDREVRAVYDAIGDRVLLQTNTAGPYANPQGRLIVEALTFGQDGSGTWSVLAEGGQKGIEGTLTVGPRPRTGAQLIFQPEKNRLIVWGGRLTFSGNPPGDPLAYALDLSGTPTWQDLGAAGDVPEGRVNASAVYDAERQRMIVFGGTRRSQNGPTRGGYALDLSG